MNRTANLSIFNLSHCYTFPLAISMTYLNYRLFRSVLELSKCKGGVWFVYFLVTNFIFNYIVLGESGLII